MVINFSVIALAVAFFIIFAELTPELMKMNVILIVIGSLLLIARIVITVSLKEASALMYGLIKRHVVFAQFSI